MTEIHQWCKMYCHILDSTSNFFQVSVILCLAACTQLKCCSEWPLFPAMWSSWIFERVPSICSLLNSSTSIDTRNFWFGIIILATGDPCLLSVLLQRHSRDCWDFQLLKCILNGFLEFDILTINEVTSSQSSCIFELRFVTCPILLFLRFRVLWHTSPDFWQQIIRSWCYLSFR